MQVNGVEHHLIWEAMGPGLYQRAESLGMETNNLHEGLPQQPAKGYMDAKLYAASMRCTSHLSLPAVQIEFQHLPSGPIQGLQA